MTNTNETFADITAEMRFHGQQNIDAEKDKPEYGILTVEGRIAQNYADRLAAAHEREVDAFNEQIADLRQQRDLWSKRAAELVEKCDEQYAKLKQVGNAAKLRDALVQVQKKINYLIGNLTVPNSLVANRMEINGIINAALAAPPRNCDIYATVEEARKVWCGKPSIDWDYLCDWLYALATEKEGGGDGKHP